MNKNSIIPIIKELERIYDYLSNYYKIKYPKPVIVIQSKGRRKNTLGWYWKDKWTLNNKNVGEINICAESLNNNPVETLIHEMVHYHNSCNKIEDCNNQNYHNKYFKQRAENYGLNVENNGRNGWAKTNLSKNLLNILKKCNINYQVFELYRKENIKFVNPTKMKKYKCNCTTVRCAVELKAKCLICNKEFLLNEIK